MNLTKEQLDVIESMAELFFTPREIAINLEVDIDLFVSSIRSEEGEAFKAYKKGYLKTDIQLRKSLLQSALNGSNPAQQTMEKYKQRTDE